MKRLLALLLCLSLFLPVCAAAEEDDGDQEYLSLFGSLDVEELDVDENGNIVLKEEEDDYFSDEDLETLEAAITMGETVDESELERNPNLPDPEKDPDDPDAVYNILLLGLDVKGTKEKKLLNQQGDYAKRADVQMILSIKPSDGTIKLTSIARNTEVDIPYPARSSLIANSYGYGVYKNGKYQKWVDTPYMSMRTINRNFELNIRYYVAINFYGVASIIEYLGGADVELTKAEASYINYYLRKNQRAISNSYDDKNGKRDKLEVRDGEQHLDGLQALMYARTRELDSDYGRTGRTRKLLSSLLTPTMWKIKTGELDPYKMLPDCGKYFITNMNAETMLKIVNIVLHGDVVRNMDALDVLVEEFRIPTDGSCYDPYKTGEATSSRERFKKGKKQENIEMLHEFIYGAYYPAN